MATYLLVRHADIDLPPLSADPSLNSTGLERAEALAQMVRSAGVTAVLTSTFARTKQTVEPLVAQSGIVAQEASSAMELAQLVTRGELGDVVVIAGHSNTVPEMMAFLGVPQPLPVIGEADFDNLFVVTKADTSEAPTTISLHY